MRGGEGRGGLVFLVKKKKRKEKEGKKRRGGKGRRGEREKRKIEGESSQPERKGNERKRE